LDEWRLVDTELDAGTELDVTMWRVALVEKAAGAVENATAGRWPSREEGWWWRCWSAMEIEDGGQLGAVESVAVAWLRWSMPWWCRRNGAVNGEERTTGSLVNMVGGECMSAYASEECWFVGLVSCPTNGNVRTDEHS
jgi:hypothetical protein